jgi:pectinesterase
MNSFRNGISRRASLTGLLATSSLGVIGARAAMAAEVFTPAPDIVVARDGSGQFTSVHAAVQSIPTDNVERKVILIKDGLYEEQVKVDAPYVTLRGESRWGVRIAFDTLDDPPGTPRPQGWKGLGQAVLNISPSAHDFVAETLTIHNTYRVTGPHAFAVMGRADRSVIQDADIYSLGADTLAMWRTGKTREEQGRSEGPGATRLTEEGGRYYHARLRVEGAVDFICPRGWCYMTDSTILQANHFVDASIWHSGTLPDHKLVITRSTFDGPPGFYLGRKHRDSAFYLIDCTFSERMRDKPIYRVIYPLDGRPTTQADLDNNARLDKENIWGDRSYYWGATRANGLYPWMRNNLSQATGAPRPSDITAKWTFAGTWDPERGPPRVTKVATTADAYELTFSELVTVKGAPRLALSGGGMATYRGGSGTNTLRFARGAGRPGALDFAKGVVIASEAGTKAHVANTRLA